MRVLDSYFIEKFLPAVARIKQDNYKSILKPFKQCTTTWQDVDVSSDGKNIFFFPTELTRSSCSPSEKARGIVRSWNNAHLASHLEPVIAELFRIAGTYQRQLAEDEEVSESMYVMF